MGLFSRDGRDRNHDGYVSPFDADETQAYVDPSRSLNRESPTQEHARQSAPDSATRVNRPKSGQTRSGRTTQTKQSADTSQSQSQTQHGQHTERRRNPAAATALLLAIVGVAYPAIAPVGSVDPRWIPSISFVTALFALLAIVSYARNHRNGGLVRAIIALLCAGGLMSGTIETGHVSVVVHNPLSGMSVSIPGLLDISGGETADEQASAGKTRDAVIHDDRVEVTYDNGKGDVGKGTFRIASAMRGPTIGAHPTIIVVYEWTNTGSQPASFSNVCEETAFQHDVSLDGIVLLPGHYEGVPEAYDLDETSSTVEPGATADATAAYLLADEKAPVEVWIGDSRFDDAMVRRFPVAGTVPSVEGVEPARIKAERVDDPIHSDAGGTAAGVEAAGKVSEDDMTTFRNVWGELHAAVIDVTRGVDGVGKQPYSLVVRVAWVNDMGRPVMFFDHFDCKASVDGVELSEGSAGVYTEEGPRFEYLSKLRYVKPGVVYMTTIAFEPPEGVDVSDVKELRVKLVGSSTLDYQTLDRTVEVEA